MSTTNGTTTTDADTETLQESIQDLMELHTTAKTLADSHDGDAGAGYAVIAKRLRSISEDLRCLDR
jgi:hypothetical protein